MSYRLLSDVGVTAHIANKAPNPNESVDGARLDRFCPILADQWLFDFPGRYQSKMGGLQGNCSGISHCFSFLERFLFFKQRCNPKMIVSEIVDSLI